MKNDDFNFLDSLNIKTPRTVSDDAFAWSNDWNIEQDHQNQPQSNEMLDDFWMNVPAQNNSNGAKQGANAFSNNQSATNLNGGKARILNKGATPVNKDPFM